VRGAYATGAGEVRGKAGTLKTEEIMIGRGYVKPWVFGVVAGSMVVSAEAFLNVYPPAAYSFCLTCHTRDLVNAALNFFFSAGFQTAAVSHRALMVSSPAALLGAYLAARLHGERTPQRGERPLLHFAIGFLVMVCGIVIFGCPTRLVVRAAYGDVYGLIAVAGMFSGVWCGTAAMRARFRLGGGGGMSGGPR
jgi:hypothetical protein